MVNRNFTSLEVAGIELPDYPLTYDANKALNAAAAARAAASAGVSATCAPASTRPGLA